MTDTVTKTTADGFPCRRRLVDHPQQFEPQSDQLTAYGPA
jgi:hypothetical protein